MIAIPSSLFTHRAWIRWKAGLGWEGIAFKDERGTLTASEDGDFFMLRRPLGKGIAMAYAQASPGIGQLARAGWRPGDSEYGAALERISLGIAPALGPDCAFIRWDIPLPAWTDPEGSRIGTRLAELRMNAPTAERLFRKAPNETLCADTTIVDLPHRTEELRQSYESRVRYSLRLAARRGTRVQETGEEGLEVFHALHRQTAWRQGIPMHGIATYRSLFVHAKNCGLDLRLYLATYDGEAVASAIIARHGSDAWYLFAASSDEGKQAAGPTAVLDRALADCVLSGDRRMDLLGVAPAGENHHPLAGLSLFKAGFGGRRFSRAGAWDFVMNPVAYASVIRAESLE